ncbi:ssDNA-binding transcriptional regulator [Corchorus olitorius]|uniref:SsDNA-binding transcriptional regulator n=1 Tax=Corchorus olitorius TaxID=93759 RepID=A0A1R3IIL5_9ROSI|nr:ssDNA-binding transcriptional regulator [Corchorus olitorius]
MLQLQFLSSPPLSAQALNSNSNLCPSLSSLKLTQTHAFKFNPLSLTPKPSKFSIKCRQSDYIDQQQRFNNSFSTASPPASAGLPPRFYVGHSIYKGKSALTVEPKPPEFLPLPSGAFKLSREGYVLLQFAPAAGVRQYDWSRKQAFSLSVTEIGTLISLGPRESCEFFHDPFKGKSEEGKVRKVLKVEPLPDGSGHFFNLGVQNKLINMDESIYIPVTRAEFAVLNSAFNFILPYLIGWHAWVNSINPNETSRVRHANPRIGGDYEWSR